VFCSTLQDLTLAEKALPLEVKEAWIPNGDRQLSLEMSTVCSSVSAVPAVIICTDLKAGFDVYTYIPYK
jgi:hypothetical protein